MIMLLLLLLLLLYLVTGLFFPVLLFDQAWSPPLRLQVSDCSTFRIMCDVRSIAVFLVSLLNVFLVWLQTFFLNFLLLSQRLHLLRVWAYISGSTSLLYFYINSCILASFPLPFYYISVCGYCHIFILLLLLLLLIYWVLNVMRDDFLIYPCLLQKSEEIMANIYRALEGSRSRSHTVCKFTATYRLWQHLKLTRINACYYELFGFVPC